MNNESLRGPELEHEPGTPVCEVSNSPLSNARSNEMSCQIDDQQSQEKQDTEYESTTLSFADLTFGTRQPPPATRRLNNEQQSARRSGGLERDLDAKDGSTISPSPSALRLRRLKSGNPPAESLLDVCASRMDIWAYSDMSSILPRLGRNMERRVSRNTSSYNYATTYENTKLDSSCLLIFLDKSDMGKEMSDTADVAEELDAYFPGLLRMYRFPTWTALEEDIIQVQLREDTIITGESQAQFRRYLNRIASKLQFQGILTFLGDADSFWAGHVPENRTSHANFIEIVPELLEGLRTFPDIKLSNKSCDKPFATASRYKQDITIYSESKGLQPAQVCMACTESKSLEDLIIVFAGAFCCQSCKEDYFDDCRACLNLVRKPVSISLPCEHSFCQDCLVHKFESSSRSPDDFPPQCCDQELFVHHFQEYLPDQVVRDHLGMLLRKLTQKETACASSGCEGRKVRHYNIVDNWALCPNCIRLTCCRCNKLKVDHKIVNDVYECARHEDEKLSKLAEENAWKTCPKCHNIVSRNGGCNTMRCRCGQGFCYTCGRAFDGNFVTCGCPMTFEEGIIDEQLPEVQAELALDGWPEMEAILNCTHINTTPSDEQFCHGCLRDREDIHTCDQCFAALCSACRATYP